MENNGIDLGSLGSIDFTPAWAKKDAGVTVGKFKPEREEAESPRARREGFGAERKGTGEKKPFEARRSAPRTPRSSDGFGGDRKGGGFGARPRFQERPKPLDVEVKILPETKALGTIMRKLQGDAHAYKLKDLAYFFLDNPMSVLLKITAKEDAAFFQCKACGFASTSQDDVIAHALSVHLTDYYDVKDVTCEPPKGNFNCVAKCGLSGVLLGPPNIHEFNGLVREMIRTKYPTMSEEQYRSHIEMVRDAEVIEQWRQGATKKTVFVAKKSAAPEKGEGADGESVEIQLTREQAEGEFRRTILPSLLDCPKHLMITADVALKSPVKPLVWAVRDAIEAERRAPYNMIFALRGAFHHRKFNFFRANDSRGPEFVTAVALKPFDSAHAVPELATVAKYVEEHPCCSKQEIVQDGEAEKQLSWLISTGHIVAFTNGVYSAVEKYPKYGPQWRKKVEKKGTEAKKETEGTTTASAEVEQKPVAGETTSVQQQDAAPVVEPAKVEEPVVEPAKVEEPVVASEKVEEKVEEVKDESSAQLA